MKQTNSKKYLVCILLVLGFGSAIAQDAIREGMKLNHVLMFKWAQNADQEAMAEVLYLFKGLPKKVDGFESIAVRHADGSTGGFDSVLVLQFVSKKALKTYEKHPDHLRIAEIGPALLEKFAYVDYWNY